MIFVILLDPYFGWRNSAYFHMVPPIILWALLYKLPESPYWLIQNGHLGQAKKSLQFFRGQNYEISCEFNEIRKKEQEKLEISNHSKTFTIIRFFSKAFWKPFSCIGVLYFMHVFDGFTPIVVYLVTFIDETGSNFNPHSGPVYVGLFRIFVAAIAPFVSRRFQPKLLYIFCYSVHGLAMVILATMSYLQGWFYKDVLLIKCPIFQLPFIGQAVLVANILVHLASHLRPSIGCS